MPTQLADEPSLISIDVKQQFTVAANTYGSRVRVALTAGASGDLAADSLSVERQLGRTTTVAPLLPPIDVGAAAA